MPSFQISITPSRRVAARFVTGVRRKLLKALEEENRRRGLKQTDIARAIGVHRSVINRELRGKKDLTLGRLGELAWAMGRIPLFELPEQTNQAGSNLPRNPNVVEPPPPLPSPVQTLPYANATSSAFSTNFDAIAQKTTAAPAPIGQQRP
jgi:transcriptional regulator with XRE-family HTH domain